MSERVFKVYQNVPWYIKESASMPDKYEDLTNDQKSFVDEFYFSTLASSPVREDLTAIKADLEDVIEQIQN